MLITGAAQRIGAAIAQMLHTAGFDLVLHYRHSADAAAALKAALEALRPDSVRLVSADLLDPRAPTVLLDAVRGFHNRLDALVNNASSFYPTPVAEATEAQWAELMGTNLKAPFFITQALAPLLDAAGGCIVNLVDIHAERPHADHPIYSMAKAGNAMMVRALARELGPRVRVNGVAPGAILWPDQGLSDAAKETILARTALARPGTPEDIARTVRFLVCDAHYITGQIIAVDGGRTIQQ
ncbi:pteridine reductase [uncultured Thiohalocapsa sp.]|uniref:pteridine reductase n=1 Tax=uncultured Thiohalocapsa sp. TaxID=768990 RepID=UPI0034592696